MTSSAGPIVGIFFQAAHHGKNRTILSSPQLEAFGNIVDDRSKHVGGTQQITTPDGIVIPIDIIDNLPYTPMRPYTDDDWLTLPHIIMTQDKWNPNALDCFRSNEEIWHNAPSDLPKDFTSSPFDIQGNYKLRTIAQTEMHFFDAEEPRSTVNLQTMYDAVDACSTKHTYEAHFMDFFPTLPTISFSEFFQSLADIDDDSEGTRRVFNQETMETDEATRTNARRERLLKVQEPDYEATRAFLGWSPLDVIKHTFAATTQYGRLSVSTLLKQRFKSPFPAMNVRRRSEAVATDTIFSDTPATGFGVKMAQIYVGKDTLLSDVYPMKSEKDFPGTLEDNIRTRGAMDKLVSDRAKSEIGQRCVNLLRYYFIDWWQSEPYHQNQNPAERRINHAKSMTNTIMDRTGTPPAHWLLCLMFVCFVLNNLAFESLQWKTPLFLATGQRNDISMLLCFVWYEPVYYKVYENSFPSESREGRGRFVGISEHVGHAMTFKVLTDDTNEVIHRSEIRSALDPKSTNLRLDDVFDGENATEFITTMRENLRKAEKMMNPGVKDVSIPPVTHGEHGETAHGETTPVLPIPPLTHGEHGETAHGENTPVPQFHPSDLVGRTFLMNEQEDGQRFRARIVEAIEQHENKHAKEPELHKF
jgi:hypothetical protein